MKKAIFLRSTVRGTSQLTEAAVGYRHFTTRPGPPRINVNVPMTSLVSINSTVSTMVFPVTDPTYVAG